MAKQSTFNFKNTILQSGNALRLAGARISAAHPQVLALLKGDNKKPLPVKAWFERFVSKCQSEGVCEWPMRDTTTGPVPIGYKTILRDEKNTYCAAVLDAATYFNNFQVFLNKSSMIQTVKTSKSKTSNNPHIVRQESIFAALKSLHQNAPTQHKDACEKQLVELASTVFNIKALDLQALLADKK